MIGKLQQNLIKKVVYLKAESTPNEYNLLSSNN